MRIRSLVPAIAISCVAIPLSVSAQSIGTLIGANISTISEAGNGVDDLFGSALNKKKKLGLKAGFYLKIPIAGGVSLEPELLYAQNGVTYQTTGAVEKESFDVDFGYVEVPVLLRIDIAHKSHIHPILLAGGSGARRVQCSFDAASGASTVKQDCNKDGDANDPVKKNDYSVIGGAGLAGQLAGFSASLQLRVSQGLTSIAKDDSEASKPKNRALSVLLGFTF
ncbi:MAG: outer membrane beta-barrel protein [Gemmatimonas sp.]